MTNFEFKARLRNVERIHAVLARHQIPLAATLQQTDTYFHAPSPASPASPTSGASGASGRLKLREIDGEAAQLIFYQRPHRAEIKRSDYLIAPVASASPLREALGAAYGIRSVVKKIRKLYWLPRKFGPYAGRAAPNLIRLHLDEVEARGHFLEIEVILHEGESPQLAEAEAEYWLREFGVAPADLIAESYADL